MSWPVVQISEIAEIVGGSTPSRNRPEYWDGDIAWATPKDLSNIEGPILEDTPQRISQAGFDSCSTYLLPKGSVLLSSRAPIGLVAIAGRAMCTNQGFKSFVLNGRLDPLYLYHFLKMSRSSLEAMGSGSTFKEISKAATARIQIPLPPLDIQKKIAAVLDKADSIRRKRKQVMAKLDELLQSVFLDMFGDPVTNPKGWEVKTVDHFVDSFSGGKSVSVDDNGDKHAKYRVAKVSAVTYGFFDSSETKAVPADHTPENQHFVTEGDLLFSRANTTELVGATAFVWETDGSTLLPDKLWRFNWNPDVPLDPLFIWKLFHQSQIRFEIGIRATGSSGSMKNISQSKVMQIPLMFPPVELQREFGTAVKRLYSIELASKRAALSDDNLFNSLLQRAFKGDLEFNDEAFP